MDAPLSTKKNGNKTVSFGPVKTVYYSALDDEEDNENIAFRSLSENNQIEEEDVQDLDGDEFDDDNEEEKPLEFDSEANIDEIRPDDVSSSSIAFEVDVGEDAGMPPPNLDGIPFRESEHGRLRRGQRGIDRDDLREAVQLGTRQPGRNRPNGDPTAIYKYKDVTYVVNEKTWEEVTSYTMPTQLTAKSITDDMQRRHDESKQRIKQDLPSWKSHAVFVVDTSGSMRSSDMFGARDRLSGVWISIAHDYVAGRLERGEAGSLDVVSVIAFGEDSRIVIDREPHTWVLYNKIVNILNRRTIIPRGHGMFLSGIEAAKRQLECNHSGSCALSFAFLSDGRPSDHGKDRDGRISAEIGTLASFYGRRLTFVGIGFGMAEFPTIEAMVENAKDFGSNGIFFLPSMTTSSLAESFSTVATSTTESQIELADDETGKQRSVREFQRESLTSAITPISKISPTNFHVFSAFHVKRFAFKDFRGHGGYVWKFDKVPIDTRKVKYFALCKKPFGEGKERFAFRFYAIGHDGRSIVGNPMVAKENRFVLEKGSRQETFIHKFCRTQSLAGRLAKEFNLKISGAPGIHKDTPRIRMLDCFVYELPRVEGPGFQSILVEDMLEVEQWKKWNGNGGGDLWEELYQGTRPSSSQGQLLRDAFMREHIDSNQCFGTENPELANWTKYTDTSVANAFSHFSYWASRRKRLVCDLQGVYDKRANELVLSDPAIHFYDPARPLNRRYHGFTDLGRDGMFRFFYNHIHGQECGPLCRLVNRGFRRVGERKPSFSRSLDREWHHKQSKRRDRSLDREWHQYSRKRVGSVDHEWHKYSKRRRSH